MIEKDGSFTKVLIPSITGKMNFKQRMDLSKSLNRGLAPRIPTTNRSPSRQFYTPQQDKLEGYSQCPRPLALPYENSIDYNMRVSTNQYKRIQKNTVDQMRTLIDSRNKSMDQKQPYSQPLISIMSGTKTAYQLNVENYRQKLMSSINQHLENKIKVQQHIEEDDAYSNINPTNQNLSRRLKKSVEQIDSLRKKLITNQSGRSVHGRVLSQPPINDSSQDLVSPRGWKNLGTSKRSPTNNSTNQSFYQSRPGTTFTGVKSLVNKSLNFSVMTPPAESQFININTTNSAINRSILQNQTAGTINFNMTTMSGGFRIKPEDKVLSGYSTLKDRYKGILIKSFLQNAKERQGLVPEDFDKQPINLDTSYMSQQQSSTQQNGWINPIPQETLNFTVFNSAKTAQELRNKIQQQDFDLNISIPQKAKEYRAKTKGRFAGMFINDPATNFSRDKKWQLIANPVARAAEDKYLRRDKFLMEKRRYQRILKEIQCEEAAGIKGVTKMPPQFQNKKL